MKNAFPAPFAGTVTPSKRTLPDPHDASKQPCKALAVQTQSWDSLRFIIDSGASMTIVDNKNNIQNYSNCMRELQVADASANALISEGNGVIQLNSAVKLKDVLYCPKVSANLLSVAQLADMGLDSIFNQHGCVVKNRKTGEIVMVGKREGNLYVYERTKAGQIYFANQLKAPTKAEIMHKRMGHINYHDLYNLQRMAEGITMEKNAEHSDCIACIKSKTTRRHFASSNSHAQKVGELVHSDLGFINVEAIHNGATMFVLFVDDASRYITVFLLNRKSETGACFMQYDKLCLNRTGRHVQVLRSDGENVFFNEAMTEYCLENGIKQQSSTKQTSQQNGRAERPIRTIVEMTHALLAERNLDLDMWGFALECAVYTKNRSPHSALRNQTPYEVMYGKVPNLSLMRIFGTIAYMYIPESERRGAGHPLFDKAKPLTFVGYSERFKGWKFIDKDTLEIYYSSEAIFFEDGLCLPQEPQIAKSLAKTFTSTIDQDEIIEFVEIEPASIESEAELEQDGVEEEIDDNVSMHSDVSDDSHDPLTSIFLILEEIDFNESRLLTALSVHVNSDTPTFAEARMSPLWPKYKEAIAKEYKSLSDLNVFSEPMDLPQGFKALNTKMVLRQKEAEFEGQERRCKARLCGKGFKQIFGIDYFETYAPVAGYEALRAFLTLMANLDYEIDTIDVITAFLLSELKEEIYITIPDGFPNAAKLQGKVLRLLKSLYGLKQAPRDWNQELDKHFRSLGFKPTESDRCLYVGRFGDKGEISCYLLVYVDDIILAAPDRKLMKGLKANINAKFPITDKGPISFFLNMHFTRDRDAKTISLNQIPKIDKLIKDPRLTAEELKIVNRRSNVPALAKEILSKASCPTDETEIAEMESKEYKSFLGILLYIALTARPDIFTAVSAVARFSTNPGRVHWNAVLKIISYLCGTRTFTLVLGGRVNMIGTSAKINATADADWAADVDGRRSRAGFIIYLFGSCVMWHSKLQSIVALSSTQAEFIALATCARMLIWLRSLLEELGFKSDSPSVIDQDNKACIDISQSSKSHPAVKHIDVRDYFIRDQIAIQKSIELKKVPTAEMASDMFTKQLPYPVFKKHRAALGLIPERGV